MSFLICFSLLFYWKFISVSANDIPDYILTAGSSGHCGQTINDSSAYVKSHSSAGLLGGLTKYNANEDCEITYDAGAGNKALLRFTFFDLESPVESGCVDSVQLTGVTEIITVSTTTTAQSPTTTAQSMATTVPTLVTTVANENATLDNATVSNETATEADVTTSTDADITTATKAPTTANNPEPTGVNATFWNTTEVCNFTQVNETVNGTFIETNETICWNVTESYVVWIPDTTPGPTSPIPTPDFVICESPGQYVSTGRTVKIRFFSDASAQTSGFSLLVTSFHTLTCSDTEFQCDTDRCISNDLVCDGVAHCVDGADESTTQANCTIISKILNAAILDKYLIVIIVVGAVVVITVAAIALWLGCGGSKGKCKCGKKAEEGGSEMKTSLTEQEPTTSKAKKSVTIASEKKEPRVVQVKPPSKKVAPAVEEDIEW